MPTSRVPILVVGHRRPATTSLQLQRIEMLDSRKVHISIDGPRNESEAKQVSEVAKSCLKWKQESHHLVTLKIHKDNLGLYSHSSTAYESFFSQNDLGIILEDDIEFRKSFIDFIDGNQSILFSGDYWSIQGHNPLPDRDFADRSVEQQIEFSQSHVHTIWGWATSHSNIDLMLKVMHDSKKGKFILEGIDTFAERVTNDPFLRNAIQATWMRKMKRANTGSSIGGWDNWWEIAAWYSNKPSLIPNFSLSRETLEQDEGQSHAHPKFGRAWSEAISEKAEFLNSHYGRSNRRLDRQMLRVWGINRKYSWAKAPKLAKESFELRRVLSDDL